MPILIISRSANNVNSVVSLSVDIRTVFEDKTILFLKPLPRKQGLGSPPSLFRSLPRSKNLLGSQLVPGTNVVNLISTYQGTDMERIYFSMGRQLDVWEYSA